MENKRKGFKVVKDLTGDEYFVSMINYDDTIYVCTNNSMYILADECLTKMEIEMEDDDVELIGDEVSLQVDGKMVNHLCGHLIKRVAIVNDRLVNIIMDWVNQ